VLDLVNRIAVATGLPKVRVSSCCSSRSPADRICGLRFAAAQVEEGDDLPLAKRPTLEDAERDESTQRGCLRPQG